MWKHSDSVSRLAELFTNPNTYRRLQENHCKPGCAENFLGKCVAQCHCNSLPKTDFFNCQCWLWVVYFSVWIVADFAVAKLRQSVPAYWTIFSRTYTYPGTSSFSHAIVLKWIFFLEIQSDDNVDQRKIAIESLRVSQLIYHRKPAFAGFYTQLPGN